MSRPILVFAGLLAVLATTQWLPYLRADRQQIATTPAVRSAVDADLRLERGQQVCIRGVEFSPRAQAARLEVRRTTGAGPPIALTASARGYRAQGMAAGGYGPRTPLVIAFSAAPDAVTDGRLCLRNAGRVPVVLLANADPRSFSSQVVTIDGKPTTKQVVVTLQERRPHPLAARLGTLLDHLAAFRPFPVGTLSLWVLLLGVGLGVPLLVGGALARALREDRPT